MVNERPATLASLAYEIGNLKDRLRDQDEEIRSLKRWKEHCTLAAAGWGGICMAVLTMGGLVHTYWDQIKRYFAGQS